jgi:hypothetical protein
MSRFVIYDELHSEEHGIFDDASLALAELRRRSELPWDAPPNQAPCTNWRNCGRAYELIEYDESVSPRKEVRRTLILEISAFGPQWRSASLSDQS